MRDAQKASWDALFGLSVIGILFLLTLLMLSPAKKRPKTSANLAMEQAIKAKDDAKAAQAKIDAAAYAQDAQTLASNELDHFTHLARTNHLQLVEFRSDKTTPCGIEDELPSTVVVQGSFVNVMNLLHDVETPGSKYMMSRLELSQTGKGDEVTANITLGAFLSRTASLVMGKVSVGPIPGRRMGGQT